MPAPGGDAEPPRPALRVAGGRGSLAARTAVALAAVGGAAALGAVPAGAAAVASIAYVGLAFLGLSGRAAGWHPTAIHVSDIVAAAAAAGLVAGAAGDALAAGGTVAALALVATAAFEQGRAAGTRIGLAAVTAAASVTLAVGHPIVLATVGMVAVLAAWLVWAGGAMGHLASGATEQQQALARLRAEMVTTVSHELRTPLTVIQGVMATLSRRWDVLSEPERLDLIDVLIDNVASLDSSILHFVDAARLERGDVVVQPEWVDVAAVIDRLQGKLGSVLAGRQVQADLAATQVWADPQALSRMLEHLLVNAVRFSAIGLPIKVRVVTQGPDTVIAVTDRGQGIAPHLLPKVWEPLERGDVSETGVSRGAGLGLPIVRELARLHGGDATLTSVKGHGTTVTVRLPRPAGPVDLEQLTELPRASRRLRRRAGLRD